MEVPAAGDRSSRRTPPASGRRSRLRALAAVALVPLAVAVVLGLSAVAAHPGGDPGDRVYDQLKLVVSAAPAAAVDVHVAASIPTHWQPVCPTHPGSRAGWTQVHVAVRFTDAQPAAIVTDELGEALTGQGRVRDDRPTSAHSGKVAHWYLDVHDGRQAQAFAFPTHGRSGRWSVSAGWTPPGSARGCP